MAECAGCHQPIDARARSCPLCGAAAAPAAPAAAPQVPAAAGPRSRRPFWIFTAVMVVAVAGGAAIVALAKRTAAERNARSLAAYPGPAAAPAAPGPAGVPARDPARAAALFRSAEARLAAGDVDGAIPLYLAALDADPGLAAAEERLGRCFRLKGDGRRAAERYRRYLDTAPPDADRVRAILEALE